MKIFVLLGVLLGKLILSKTILSLQIWKTTAPRETRISQNIWLNEITLWPQDMLIPIRSYMMDSISLWYTWETDLVGGQTGRHPGVALAVAALPGVALVGLRGRLEAQPLLHVYPLQVVHLVLFPWTLAAWTRLSANKHNQINTIVSTEPF